jgi:hypothetical protein
MPPYNGAGQFTPSAADNPVVSGTLIQSTKFNNTINDIATGLSLCLTKDGQQVAAANLPMGGFRHTNVANAANRNEYATVGQVQDSGFVWCGTAGGGADALTLTPTPAITVYTAGQTFIAKAGATNTGAAATVAISSLATKTLQNDGNALAAGDITSGKWYTFTYDGVNVQVNHLSSSITVAALLAGTNAWAGANSFLDAANFSIKNVGDTTKIWRVDATGIPTGTTVTSKVAAAGVLEGQQGANIASAATVNLDTATGDYNHITGVTTITAVTLTQGRQRVVVFDGALTLTNGASLILPGSANILTVAGDSAVLRGEAGGVVRVVSYTRVTGLPIVTSVITASLGADVALNNTANYFDGPSVAQGTSGTWFVTGTLSVQDTSGAAQIYAKLWDGTTVIASCDMYTPVASGPVIITLSGFLASPAGNLRISAKDISSTSGVIKFNLSGNSKDSTITAIRIT